RLGRGWEEAVAARTHYAFEGRLWHEPSGEYRHVLERGVPIIEADGSIGMWAGTGMDRHERRPAEEAYPEGDRTLEILNRVGTTLVSELNLERLVQSATDAARELAGAEIAAFIDRSPEERGDGEALFALSGGAREALAAFPTLRAAALFELTFGGRSI